MRYAKQLFSISKQPSDEAAGLPLPLSDMLTQQSYSQGVISHFAAAYIILLLILFYAISQEMKQCKILQSFTFFLIAAYIALPKIKFRQ
ncbi:MAG: hypothetical protein IJM38_05440 [Ruminococcus sp.]|nr:hypothetical protein [Ruminococcus sp.]